jgi:hypothetical protein
MGPLSLRERVRVRVHSLGKFAVTPKPLSPTPLPMGEGRE